jgi:hypothetical protein
MFSNISSKDNTSEIEFLGKFTNYSLNKIKEGLINITEPKETGIVDKQSKIIDLADLFGEMPINYSDSIQGILLPQNELLRRDKYSFINRMTFEDIAKSDMMICKHLLTSN